jgi:hypothetical protein
MCLSQSLVVLSGISPANIRCHIYALREVVLSLDWRYIIIRWKPTASVPRQQQYDSLVCVYSIKVRNPVLTSVFVISLFEKELWYPARFVYNMMQKSSCPLSHVILSIYFSSSFYIRSDMRAYRSVLSHEDGSSDFPENPSNSSNIRSIIYSANVQFILQIISLWQIYNF